MKKFLLAFLVLALLSSVNTFAIIQQNESLREAELWIMNTQTFPAVIESGDQDVILQFDVVHRGSRTFYNITIEAKFQSPFEPIKNTYFISQIDASDRYTSIFRFNVEDVEPGVYTIPIDIHYSDSYRMIKSYLKRYIYLQVSSTPRLELVEMNAVKPAYVGSDFEIRFVVNNTGTLPAAEAVVTVTMENNSAMSWIPSQMTTGYIPQKSLYNISLRGVVSSNTVPGAYGGTLNISYGGTEILNKFVLDIYGKPDIRIAGVSTDKDPVPGAKISLSIQLENIGTGDAESVNVEISDNNLRGTLESYIGTIEIDDTGSAIFDIIFSNTGSINVPLSIRYQGEDGKQFSITANASLYIYSSGADYTFLIIFVIVIALVYYFFFFRKKKIRKLLKKIEG